ncbi:MAG TPA: hypothetical protein VFZ65_10585 [Planctomycetota bacterium]|nr:hypothetical protein [Planctomycetota bacterium]
MPREVTSRRVLSLWWPLAGSWLLMAAEMPLLAMALTRLPGGEVHLAALGALVYPLSMLIEAPIIMLLAASTALARDLAAHERLRRFAHAAGAALTLVHVLVAFTPLFDVIALDLLGVPAAVVEPGRIGMRIMTPWTWAIAYRRFQQGALIRCERSDLIVTGTVIRLLTNVAVLATGLAVGTWPGIVVGTVGVACGVVAESVWAGWCFHQIGHPLLPAHSDRAPLSWRAFAAFYLPLAFTPLITIVIQPIGAWAMSKMAEPLLSLAAWPAVYGLVFLTRSAGFAFNEVVVALAGEPGGRTALRRCGVGIAVVATAVLLLLAETPLGGLWFGTVTGMTTELATLASASLLFAMLMPGYAVAQNYHQGLLVHGGRTRAITEAVVLYLVLCWLCLAAGVEWLRGVPGIQVALGSFTIAGLAQTAWLWWRRRGARRSTQRP